MSEKGKEIEEGEDEREIIDHWSHKHPLTLVEITSRGDRCEGCERFFSIGEQAYECSRKIECWYRKLLHEECARLPRKIRHPLHPQHILIQKKGTGAYERKKCAICELYMNSIGYFCISLECEFRMHMRCAQDSGVMNAADDEEEEQRRTIRRHPSHPKHDLRLYERCSFKCDGCGTTRRGKACICTRCQYWIHEKCATLDQTIKREDHHHSLSLSYHVPPQYIKFKYKCNVCNKYMLAKYWIYHCHICSYVVHVKCAFNKATGNDAGNDKDIIRLPINDAAEELISPFVMRQKEGGAILAPPIPHDDDNDEMVKNVKYKFLHHEHQLTLVSSSSSHHYRHHQNEEEEEEEDDDYGKRSGLICDGCITPIFSSSSSASSSSSSSEKKDYYLSCSECKYFLHLACFHLPHQLPSLPLHDKADHDLVLKSCDAKLEPWSRCNVCKKSTNGLFYECMKCSFIADIKCASLPDTIYHAAHPQHLLKHMFITTKSQILSCAADCDAFIYRGHYCYTCDSCDFAVHAACAMLPASVRSRRWDKHHPLLRLTFDANLNHPGEFYCDECETEMNPKSWMYHCRHCDLSFHPKCFPVTSGEYRNIKFGGEYVIPKAHHPHPLTYQLLTTKRRCDLCGGDRHKWRGFQCASCNFCICFYNCVQNMITKGDKIQAVD